MRLHPECTVKKMKNNFLSRFSDGESKVDKFQLLLDSPLLNLDELRQLSWSGVPAKLRSVTWRLLSVSNYYIQLYHLILTFVFFLIARKLTTSFT